MTKRDFWQFIWVCVIVVGMISSYIMLSACSTTGGLQLNVDNEFLIEQTVDTLGYSVGLLAYKDPELRKDVEYNYKMVKDNGLTMAMLNALMDKYASKDIAYQLLVYKLAGLIEHMGGQVLPDGTIESLGDITDKHLEVGKNAYLLAIKNSEVSAND